MKIDKLLKRLKKDAAASPQKAGALALMVVVALYFWAPLAGKYLPGKAKKQTVTATSVILTDDPILAKAVVHPASDSAHWDRVRSRLAADQMLVAAIHDARWQHPFARLHQAKSESSAVSKGSFGEPNAPQPGQPPQLSNQPDIKPEAAQAALKNVLVNTILIGPRDRAVVIRGMVYRVGDVLTLGGDAGEPSLELRICSIDEQGVDVAFEQQRLRLERPKPQLSPGDHLRRN